MKKSVLKRRSTRIAKEKGYMKYVIKRQRARKAISLFSRSKFVLKKTGGMKNKVGRSGPEEETDGPKSKKKSKLPPCCSWYTGEMKKEVDKWAEAEREEQDRLYPELEQQWRDREERIKQGLRRILARSRDKAKKEEEEKDKAKKEEEEKKVVVQVLREEVEDEEAAAKCFKAMGERAAESLIRNLSA